MEIRWSLPAAEDLQRICAWIERDNPEAAKQVATTIYHGITQLKHLPGMGRTSTRMSGWRELIFSPLPYIAVYRVKHDAIEIARIYHGAQNWPRVRAIIGSPCGQGAGEAGRVSDQRTLVTMKADR